MRTPERTGFLFPRFITFGDFSIVCLSRRATNLFCVCALDEARLDFLLVLAKILRVNVSKL
jgi:hypothetical protein